MNYGGNPDEFAAVGGIHFPDQTVFFGRAGVEEVEFRRGRDGRNQVTTVEVQQKLASGIGVYVQALCDSGDGPRLGAIMPEEEQRFEVGHAVNLLENEAKYLRIFVNLRHEVQRGRSRKTWGLRAFQCTE